MDRFFDFYEAEMRPYLVRSPLDQLEVTTASLLTHEKRQQDAWAAIEETCRELGGQQDDVARAFGLNPPAE